ncbi:hypothetical protein NQ317_001399 [Molorchus minor]|uniref:Uncharacterized protein n=1 Tax=Molorchus minor TaxID=1323400 RepID=A0ABQ9J6V3_9CUCU|nr:hypothetical protein NQ317_001399 [Molorchus minor]
MSLLCCGIPQKNRYPKIDDEILKKKNEFAVPCVKSTNYEKPSGCCSLLSSFLKDQVGYVHFVKCLVLLKDTYSAIKKFILV